MSLDREPIFDALFTRLAAIPGLRTASRKWRPLDNLTAAEFPALFLATGSQTPTNRRGLPTVWTIEATVYVYTANDDPAGPGVELNRIIREVEAALERSPEELAALERDPRVTDAMFLEIQNNPQGTTLGGLCSHAWIAGTIETDEGILMDKAAAAIPLEILTF